MADITTIWNGTTGDWQVGGAALSSGDDLATAVLISLFTDRQISADETAPDGTDDPRGWWGDEGQYLIGSRLWLLERAKRTQDTLTLAQSYIEEALQWMVDDGIVARFAVYVEWTRDQMLGAQVTAYRTDGATKAMNFAWAWAAQQPVLSAQQQSTSSGLVRTYDGSWSYDGEQLFDGVTST
jgi:phage gp46-like protein